MVLLSPKTMQNVKPNPVDENGYKSESIKKTINIFRKIKPEIISLLVKMKSEKTIHTFQRKPEKMIAH